MKPTDYCYQFSGTDSLRRPLMTTITSPKELNSKEITQLALDCDSPWSVLGETWPPETAYPTDHSIRLEGAYEWSHTDEQGCQVHVPVRRIRTVK